MKCVKKGVWVKISPNKLILKTAFEENGDITRFAIFYLSVSKVNNCVNLYTYVTCSQSVRVYVLYVPLEYKNDPKYFSTRNNIESLNPKYF